MRTPDTSARDLANVTGAVDMHDNHVTKLVLALSGTSCFSPIDQYRALDNVLYWDRSAKFWLHCAQSICSSFDNGARFTSGKSEFNSIAS